ncbi:MAG: metallophosphoesterase, partial [Clostridia bacterium]|nr:metallophosphoesterase [Clostridia bacterium]
MKNFRLTQKATMSIALIAIILLCLVCSGFGVAIAEENASNDIKVVHITDLHYYPTYLCYEQSKENYNDSAMVSKSKLESKLIVESSAVIKKLFADISGYNLDGNKKNSLPDYLVVTGDLSSDGERVALIDIANALRDLQNKIRAKGKENFQIFVIPGNHDISNKNATDYSTLNGAPIEGVNRNDFAKIFAGLGYPNMSFGEAAEYYANDEFDNNNLKYLPYEAESRYVESTNAKGIDFSYMSMNDWNQELGDGDLSYVANCLDGNTFVAIDGIIKGNIGGQVNASVFSWLESIKQDKLTGNLISLTHHNILQHFTMQEKWSKDYLFSNWEQVRDYFVKVGVKYNFSGHMHANDIASYCNYDGYNIYDLETGSPVGYGAQYRETNISFLADGSSDLTQKLCTITDVDVSELIKDGYLVKEQNILFSTGIGENGKIADLATYINERLYVNMLDNVLNSSIQLIDRDNFATVLY